MIAVGDREQEIFLGREISQRREISERMSELVDNEVKRFIDEAYAAGADASLIENRDLLDRIAAALLERETLDREDIDLLARGASRCLPARRRCPHRPSVRSRGHRPLPDRP